MYSIERKSEIISLLEKKGKVDVNDLAVRFDISKETIRRDLHDLEKDGVLKRTHGGAVLNSVGSNIPAEYPVTVRGIQRLNEKNVICRKAAEFVREGDIIFVDNSSTTAFLAKYISRDIHATILTNSLNLLIEATKYPCPNHMYICLGGIFKTTNLSMHGNITIKNAGEFYPNKTFISCTGINPVSKIADASIQEADAKRLMIERAQTVYLLADYTKFEKSGQVFLADFNSIDTIITDRNVNRHSISYLESEHLRVLAL